MWTEQSFGRMAKSSKKIKRYPSNLTNEKWEQIKPLMPKPGRRGRPREVDFREAINAVRYLVRSGCGWRMLPIHFGPWQTVYGWFHELARRFLFQTIHDVALMVERERAGRSKIGEYVNQLPDVPSACRKAKTIRTFKFNDFRVAQCKLRKYNYFEHKFNPLFGRINLNYIHRI